MQIAQRGTSFTASGYSLDRWYLVVLGSSTVTQSSNAPAGFTNSLLWTTNSASTPANVAFYNGFSQLVEGYNVSDLGFGASGAKSVTFSFWVKANNTGTYPLAFNNVTSTGTINSAGRSYVTTYTVNSANTWEQKTITIAGDTSGTWNTTTSAGFTVWFDVGSGSNYTTSTLNAWQSGAYFYTSGVVNVQNTNSATLQITGVQLEAGTTASPFEYRQYGTELALCQRYFWKIGGTTVYEQIAMGLVDGGSNVSCITSLPVAMRTAPSVGYSSASAFQINDAAVQVVTTAVAIYQPALQTTGIVVTVAPAPLTLCRAARFFIANSLSAYINFSAEL